MPRNAGALGTGRGSDITPPLERPGEPPGRLWPQNSKRVSLCALEPVTLWLGVRTATGDPCAQPGQAGTGRQVSGSSAGSRLEPCAAPSLQVSGAVLSAGGFRRNFPPLECFKCYRKYT